MKSSQNVSERVCAARTAKALEETHSRRPGTIPSKNQQMTCSPSGMADKISASLTHTSHVGAAGVETEERMFDDMIFEHRSTKVKLHQTKSHYTKLHLC